MSESVSHEQTELQEARDAFRKSFDGPTNEEVPAGTPVAAPPVAPDPIITQGSPQDERPGTPVVETPAEAPEGQDYARLRQDYEALQKQFKAIQASVTPVQQERSELRRKVQALEEELRGTVKTPQGDSVAEKTSLDAPEFKEKLDAIREVMPEAADLLEVSLRESQRLQAEATKRSNDAEIKRQEAIAKATMDELFRQRPIAQQLDTDPNFWAWIDAQGTESNYYRKILSAPWEEGHFQATLAILDAYPGAPLGAPTHGAPTPVAANVPPHVAATSHTAPRPTDIGVPIRGGVLPNTQANPGRLTESQVQEMEISMRRGGHTAAEDVVKKMRENWKLSAKR